MNQYYDLDLAAHWNKEQVRHVWTATVVAQGSAPVELSIADVHLVSSTSNASYHSTGYSAFSVEGNFYIHTLKPQKRLKNSSSEYMLQVASFRKSG